MTDPEAEQRADRLREYLAHDPANRALRRDAAEAALNANRFEAAIELLEGLDNDAGSREDRNLLGIVLMRGGRPAEAAHAFEALLAEHGEDSGLCFNLAWSRALAGDFEGARAALSETAIQALPQAALLDVQLLHEAQAFDDAIGRAKAHIERFIDYEPLLAAVSVLALDVEDEELALRCASAARSHPDALTTLGTLSLAESNLPQAKSMFERALAVNAHNPRARVGLGLAHLVAGDATTAGPLIDGGAEQFGDHLGSWIGAGWAYLVAGDREIAKARFERALVIDDTFAETHGSLAVVAAIEGNLEEAERRSKVALRLDGGCFSAALARVLIANAKGDEALATKIIERAFREPVGPHDRTLADAVMRIAR